MFFTFDLCLLLYVIRLAGWLKHCNLSLSLSLAAQRHGNAQQGQQLLFAPLAIPGACGQRLRRHHAFPGHAWG